jgi:hypothetical protein
VLTPVISSEELAERKTETIRTVNFKSDSLTLTLYDNGIVDGGNSKCYTERKEHYA